MRSLQRSTQAARINDCVKTPEQTAPLGAKRSAKSRLPETFNPACIPEALKPLGAVIPPEGIRDQIEDAAKLKTLKSKLPYSYLVP